MKKFILIAAAAVSMFASVNLGAWGKRTHAAIAIIAENHMTPEAQAKVRELLGGYHMVTFASYLDEYRKKMMPLQHVQKVDLDFNSVSELYNSKGEKNGVIHIQDCINDLKHYKDLDDSTRRVDLYCIIHLIGDMHCPSHISYKDGRQKFCGKLIYKGKETNFHHIWDGTVLDAKFAGGPLDLAYICDTASPEEIAEIQKGDVRDWEHDCAESCKEIFVVEKGAEIGHEYVLANWPLAADQTRKAGYRLAKVMNDLFSK